MTDLQMPSLRRAPVNGLDMAYYEVGPRQGAPVIFCHGFPEIAFSWRHQLKAFEAAGRWAVAPDQRGYGLTTGPAGVADCDMEHLTGDLVGLLDHLGVEKAIFCGHDWGGFVVWQMPLMHPDRCAGVIGLNTPFLARYPIEPIELFRRAYGEEMYIVKFQPPGEAEAILEENVEKSMRFFMRRPAPATPENVSQPKADGRPAFALLEALQAFDTADNANQLLTPEQLAVFVDSFERSGFTGGVNWYRNFTRNWERSGHLPTRIDGPPCLMIMAENDAVLPPSMADGMEERVGDLEKALIRGSGHWTQQEKPQEVSGVILDWMDRRFPR